MRGLVLGVIRKIRGEEIELGNFSNSDLLRIVLDKITCMFRGFIYLNIPFLSKGIFFMGNGSVISGRNKINFNLSATIGSRVKISSIGSPGYEFGKNFSIRDFSIIDSYGSIKKESGRLKIGNNVGISEYCYIGIRGNLYIGNDVIIGPGVKIFTENHSVEISNIPFRMQNEVRKDVIIGNNVWIGANAVILPGVIVHDNSVIAAGSIVSKNVEKSTIVGGVPAKLIKNLN